MTDFACGAFTRKTTVRSARTSGEMVRWRSLARGSGFFSCAMQGSAALGYSPHKGSAFDGGPKDSDFDIAVASEQLVAAVTAESHYQVIAFFGCLSGDFDGVSGVFGSVPLGVMRGSQQAQIRGLLQGATMVGGWIQNKAYFTGHSGIFRKYILACKKN